MRNQRAFHFRRAQPKPVDLEQIVNAPRMPEVTIRVLIILIAGSEPVPYEGFFRLLVLIPVARADGIPANPKIANLIRRDGNPVVVNNFSVKPRQGLAARPAPSACGA